MDKQFKVAVVGATGAVGEALLEILAERKFPAREIVALASEKSAGKEVAFGRRKLVAQDLAAFDFAGTDFALFSAGAKVSAVHAPRAAAAVGTRAPLHEVAAPQGQ